MSEIYAVTYGGTSKGKTTRRTRVGYLQAERDVFGDETGLYYVWSELGAELCRIGEVENRGHEGWSARSGDRFDGNSPSVWLGCFNSRERALYRLIPEWVRLPHKAYRLSVTEEAS